MNAFHTELGIARRLQYLFQAQTCDRFCPVYR